MQRVWRNTFCRDLYFSTTQGGCKWRGFRLPNASVAETPKEGSFATVAGELSQSRILTAYLRF